ncbi:cobalt-precorrin-6A reductase [Chelativorans sp. ZYF759]|uniref:cobalt-precorrin-6A reductase n=1 Tax=Chelativorans sp. ZYF759 TaxID=2692213 RepID=UPI0016AF2EDB|nr:cobalt-precorrin-6A reductase [Chelativorans sp. ZYF759]NMG38449.1 cobalt-precorrin-6A reductase [Chelativorans sp. ZYF759]
MMAYKILILGGTTEARELAARLAGEPRYETKLSLAGRTARPAGQPVPVRVGGFGGAEGLAAHLAGKGIDLLVDATHPFAARISANAAEAARVTKVPLLALRRPGWERGKLDRWTEADTVAAAVVALGERTRRVLVTLGRQELAPLRAHPHHFYLIRSVDPVDPPLDLPDAQYLLARGPFGEDDERRLLIDHRIDAILSKNSGGAATYGKIAAARGLGIEVVMVRRPPKPVVPTVGTVDEAVAEIAHRAASGKNRGV